MDTSTVVPGLDAYAIGRLTRVHQLNMEVTDGNSWVARAFGSDLLAHVTATMQQLFYESEVPGLQSRPSDLMVYYAGHDINICEPPPQPPRTISTAVPLSSMCRRADFLRVLLGLSWLTESWNPNQSPPGGMLRFELLRGPPDSANQPFYVKAYFESQSMDQQRQASPLDATNPPDRSFVAIPGCAGGPENSCPFGEFKALALRAVDQECVVSVPAGALR